MTAGKVLELLGITRRTLSNYVSSKKIKVVKLNNGFYDYNDIDVQNLLENKVFKNKVIVQINGKRAVFDVDKNNLNVVINSISAFLNS